MGQLLLGGKHGPFRLREAISMALVQGGRAAGRTGMPFRDEASPLLDGVRWPECAARRPGACAVRSAEMRVAVWRIADHERADTGLTTNVRSVETKPLRL